jgi:hypothetical protein
VSVEGLENWLNTLEIVVLESLELLDGLEQFNQFLDSSAEKIELTKDLSW